MTIEFTGGKVERPGLITGPEEGGRPPLGKRQTAPNRPFTGRAAASCEADYVARRADAEPAALLALRPNRRDRAWLCRGARSLGASTLSHIIRRRTEKAKMHSRAKRGGMAV
jgi:hypothetical protein